MELARRGRKSETTTSGLHRNRHQAGSRGLWTNQTGANEPHRVRGLQATHAVFYRARQGKTGQDRARRHLQRLVTASSYSRQGGTHSAIPASQPQPLRLESTSLKRINFNDNATASIGKSNTVINWIPVFCFDFNTDLAACQVPMIHWPPGSFRTDAPTRHHSAPQGQYKALQGTTRQHSLLNFRQLSPVPL